MDLGHDCSLGNVIGDSIAALNDTQFGKPNFIVTLVFRGRRGVPFFSTYPVPAFGQVFPPGIGSLDRVYLLGPLRPLDLFPLAIAP